MNRTKKTIANLSLRIKGKEMIQDLDKELARYKVIAKYKVQWGHMDSARHVNNTVYLRWAESARIKYFETIQMDTGFAGEGVGPILGWQDCKYIFPMTYPDTAIVGVRTSEIRNDRFLMEAAIYSTHHKRIAAISKQVIIPYNYVDLCKLEMPKHWIDNINDLDFKN